MQQSLSIPEEILLLSLGETKGAIPDSKKFEVVLSASILMDLALQNRLDSDLEKLILVKDTPTGDPVLDESIALMFKKQEDRDPAYWIAQIALRSREFVEFILANLTVKRIVTIERKKVLWLFTSRKFPLLNDGEIKEIRNRVHTLIFSDAIPDVKDIVLVSLLHYGDMLSAVFTSEEIIAGKERIEQIAKMDLIGQAISKSLTLLVAKPFSSFSRNILGSKTPEEKLELLVQEMREKFSIKDDKDLPGWLRKGTAQYEKTLDFVRKTGTADIYYHHIKDQYFLKSYASQVHIFGGGG